MLKQASVFYLKGKEALKEVGTHGHGMQCRGPHPYESRRVCQKATSLFKKHNCACALVCMCPPMWGQHR